MESFNNVHIDNLKKYLPSNLHYQDEEFKHNLDVFFVFLMFVNAINATNVNTNCMDKEN